MVYLLSRRLGLRTLTLVCGALYLLGLSGDSYYGLTQYLPPLRSLCDLGFHVWSYTRNGLFLAPLFLLMGALMGGLQRKNPCANKNTVPGQIPQNPFSALSSRASAGEAAPAAKSASALTGAPAAKSTSALAAGLVLSLLGMSGESFLLRYLESLRHDSMYLLLVPVMYCLYGLLLCSNCPPCPRLRRISTLIYILHPAVIVAVRIFARLPHMLPLMEQSLLHYAAVCLLSLAAAWLLTGLRDIKIKRSDHDR